jgi:predicted alpha/beta-hydrolase family hydrolase
MPRHNQTLAPFREKKKGRRDGFACMASTMVQIEAFERSGIRGFLHQPQTSIGQGLVLTHGAGGDSSSALLVEAASAFSAAGLTVLRCDLPFRQRRRSGPPSPATAAADRVGLKNAATAMRDLVSGRVILGGQSYGGRQATILAADEDGVADGLLIFSYPLHPPGKPDRLRTEHFPRLSVPAVFVHGTADPFGSIDELRRAISAIRSSVQLIPIGRAGHDLRRGRFDLSAVTAAVLG